jgi:hypothetical protein
MLGIPESDLRNALANRQFAGKVRSDFVVGYAAASTVRRHSSSMACATMDPTTSQLSLRHRYAAPRPRHAVKAAAKNFKKLMGIRAM